MRIRKLRILAAGAVLATAAAMAVLAGPAAADTPNPAAPNPVAPNPVVPGDGGYAGISFPAQSVNTPRLVNPGATHSLASTAVPSGYSVGGIDVSDHQHDNGATIDWAGRCPAA
jgi:hypothetical protein